MPTDAPETDTETDTEPDTESDESYSYYELYAIYATDHPTGARIQQLLEATAPTDASKTHLKQVVADATNRTVHSIEDVEIVASGERPEVNDTAVFYRHGIELGGV